MSTGASHDCLYDLETLKIDQADGAARLLARTLVGHQEHARIGRGVQLDRHRSDGDLANHLARGRVYHGDCVFLRQRHQDKTTVRREADLSRTLAYLHLRDLLLADGINDRHRAALEVGDVGLLAVRTDAKTVGKLTDRNCGDNTLRRCVNHTHRVVAAVGDVGKAAIWRHHHMGRVRADRHLGDYRVTTGINGPNGSYRRHRAVFTFGHFLMHRASRLIRLAVIGHPYDLSVGRYLHVVRCLADAHACQCLERRGIEHADRVSALIGHIHLVSGPCSAGPGQQPDLYCR